MLLFLTGGESFALALIQRVFLFGWCGGMVCAYVCVRTLNQKRKKGRLSPLPSTPIPDGVSLGPLINIDVRGHG